MSRVDAILARLATLYPRAIDLSLDRVRALMHRLGDPQDRLAPVIHVAGTNGKGSTIAFLRACLEAAGYRVHVYTSPHLIRFAERIRLAGRLIEDDALSALLAEVEQRNAGEPITLFEVTTAAAFLAFARTPADVVLLETGLGGRLDATNLVVAPAAAAITPISLDHMSFLGDTIEKIAGEKAGILKPGCPAVIARQPANAAAVIAARAEEIGAPLFRQGLEWDAEPREGGWRFRDETGVIDLPLPRLIGTHQIGNAGTALACLRLLGALPIGDSALAKGMATVEWPARLERLMDEPISAELGPGWEVWLDGGHNPGAAEMLAQVVRGWRDRPLYLVLGMLANRDPAEFVAPLAPHVAAIKTVTIPDEANAYRAEDCALLLADCGVPVAPSASIMAAVATIRDQAHSEGGRILICGSLYLAGQVLALKPQHEDRG
jgi:dihydrofolate synthase/folylpolyglutamate synthase